MDGCRAGWIVCLRDVDGRGRLTGASRFLFRETFAEIVALRPRPAITAVDMPMGFADAAERGGRACERAARALLPGKSSSVFAVPARAMLAARSYPEALRLNRASGPDAPGLSKQAWHLFGKLNEVDACLTPHRQRRIIEAHPELAFARLNVGAPVLSRKRAADGARERLRLLARAGFGELQNAWAEARSTFGLRRTDAADDDAWDAAAVCRTAWLALRGEATALPQGKTPRDARGLTMRIWF